MTEGGPVFRVNLDDMLIGDLETLERPESSRELLDTLQRIIVGTDIRKLPLRMLPDIAKAVLTEVQTLQRQKN